MNWYEYWQWKEEFAKRNRRFDFIWDACLTLLFVAMILTAVSLPVLLLLKAMG